MSGCKREGGGSKSKTNVRKSLSTGSQYGVVHILRNQLGGGGFQMITLHVIVTNTTSVNLITEGEGGLELATN